MELTYLTHLNRGAPGGFLSEIGHLTWGIRDSVAGVTDRFIHVLAHVHDGVLTGYSEYVPFVEFDRRSIPLMKQPFVTIQSKGTLGFNASSHAALGEPEAVVMMYDEEAKLIGFRAAEVSERNAYPMRAVGAGKTFIVAGTAFLNYFKIPYGDEPIRYEATMVDGILTIDLTSGGHVATSNRTVGEQRRAEGQLFDGNSGEYLADQEVSA